MFVRSFPLRRPADGAGHPRWLASSLWVVSAALLGVTVYRAATLAITTDESRSFFVWVLGPWRNIVVMVPNDANNHVLNTLGMKLGATLFGPTELALRWTNVVGHALFLLFSVRLVARLRSSVALVTGFLLLNLNAYLLDFFALARGYGIAVGLMMGATYHLVRFHALGAPRDRRASLIFGALGVVAHFTLMHVYLTLLALLSLLSLQRALPGARGPWRVYHELRAPLAITGLLAAAIYVPLSRIAGGTTLDHGVDAGFWNVSVRSFVDAYLYCIGRNHLAAYQAEWVCAATFYVVVALTLLMAAYWLGRFVIAGNVGSRPGTLVLVLLVLPGVGIVTQSWILGTLLPLWRTGLYFQPLFFLALVHAMDELVSSGATRQPTRALAGALCLLVVYHASRSMNLTHTIEYPIEADTRAVFDDLERHLRSRGLQRIRLGLGRSFEGSVKFYAHQRGGTWLASLQLVWHCDTDWDVDYVIHDGGYPGQKCFDDSTAEAYLARQGMTILARYPISRGVLAFAPSSR